MARKYEYNYKVQAKKLAKIGGDKAAKELGVPIEIAHTWLKVVKVGKLDIDEGFHTPSSAMDSAEKITVLSKRVKYRDK